jgi:hypothetical protein
MSRKVTPGLAFHLVCDRGFAVGLHTYRDPQMGPLVWLADRFWDDEPTVDDASRIDRWKWCVFFPLGAALRRGLVTALGHIPVPPEIAGFPVMRAGSSAQGWYVVRGPGRTWPLEATTDARLPPRIVVNDVRLKEMLVSNWTPEDRW